MKPGTSPDGEWPGFRMSLTVFVDILDTVNQRVRSGSPFPAGAVGPSHGVGDPQQWFLSSYEVAIRQVRWCCVDGHCTTLAPVLIWPRTNGGLRVYWRLCGVPRTVSGRYCRRSYRMSRVRYLKKLPAKRERREGDSNPRGR